MLLNQACVYYMNCARTVDECKVCKLCTHREADTHVQTLLQVQFDGEFGLTPVMLEHHRGCHCLHDYVCVECLPF